MHRSEADPPELPFRLPSESPIKEVGFVDLLQDLIIFFGKAGW
jgi:hypothetical protein